MGITEFLRLGDAMLIRVNNDKVHALGCEGAGYLPAHAPEAAEDVVIPHVRQCASHSSSPHERMEYLFLYYMAHQRGEEVEHRPHAAHNQKDVEDAPGSG